jgi:hypothetical protein
VPREDELVKVDVQLLCDQQQQSGRRALPHFHAAGLHLDGVVGMDREERVGRPEVERAARGKRVDARPRPACSRERHDQRAAAFHEDAPRERRGRARRHQRRSRMAAQTDVRAEPARPEVGVDKRRLTT